MSTDRHPATSPPEVIAATWVCIRNQRLLVVRPGGQTAFYLPGGTPEPGETLDQTTAREVAEETGIRIRPENLHPLVEVVAAAHGRPGVQVRLVCFTASSDQEPVPGAEIDEVAWFTSVDATRCAPAVRDVARSAVMNCPSLVRIMTRSPRAVQIAFGKVVYRPTPVRSGLRTTSST